MPDFTAYTRQYLTDTLNAIAGSIYTIAGDLEITAWRTPEPVPFNQRCSGEELHLKAGDKWGDLFDCAWFRFRGQIPSAAAGQPVALLLDVNGEMCVVDETGLPVRGLTNLSSSYDFSLGLPGKRVFPLTPSATGGERVEVWADAGCNDLFGNLQENGTVKLASIAICHEDTRALYYDVEVLLDSLTVLPQQSARYQQIATALTDVRHLLVAGSTPESIQQARTILSPQLSRRGGDPSLSVSAIGHAHMDLAWLWPIRETKRKGARTFATALALMEKYPDYIFAASQYQYYQWMKESYPALYAKIKQRVKEGRIEPQGALWVECDTNVTGGESLVRQILHGRRFARAEFGIDVHNVWLPDTFGYSGALPQIMKLAGIRYFSTQKLSWSLVNAFPHQSFRWQGIDGSQVLVHMLPEETYNSPALPHSLARLEANYRDKGVSGHAFMAFGIGDGGGGPGEEHLERLARLQNLAGLCPVTQEWTAAFFERWATDAERFATWVGELYLERHQGTLTTNARNKRFNRRMEQGLREWEWLAALAEATAGKPYPSARLQEVWQEALLYQFHDILPGSAIKRVYDETTVRYEALLAEVEMAIEQAARALAQRLHTEGMTRPHAVFNSLSWPRTEWLHLGEGWQRVTVPAMGHAVVDAAGPYTSIPALHAAPDRLENDCLLARFDESGALVSLFDKVAGREVIAQGAKANALAVYHDLGDAWDFALDYADSQPRYLQLVSAAADVDGPRAVLVQEYRIGATTLTQEISLTAGSAVLEFATHTNWRERQAMLRTSFPVAIQASEASYEIQFGHIHRPTHRNTTWDLAMDEVAAHKWADLSQRDYGVALLNDCKYGHKIKGNVIDLDLIRSVPYPGPVLVKDEDVQPGQPHHGYTDQVEHVFRYALYPHRGDLVEGGVTQAGYEFNTPLRVVETGVHAGAEEPSATILHVEPSSIIVESVKKAEDGQGWIIRLYEASGSSVASCTVTMPLHLAGAALTDLLEDELQPLTCTNGQIELDFHPFEIKTLRLAFTA